MLRIQRANAAALAAKNRQNGTPIKPILEVPIAPALSSAQAQAEADVARARAKKAARKAEDVARQARMTATMAKMVDQRATGGMGQGGKRENPADPGSAAFHKRQSAEKKKAAESRREALMGRTNVGGPPAIPVAGNGVASGSGSSASSANGGNNRMDLDPKKMGGEYHYLLPSIRGAVLMS
jgi:soluble lytic murein transglycosylase-like protein